MAILMLLELPGTTTEEYDELNRVMGIGGDDSAPEGLIEHVVGTDGSNLVIADVWESADALGRFVEGRLRPALETAGIAADSEPRVLPVHNRLKGTGSEPAVIMLIEIDDLGPDAYDQMVSSMDAHVGDGSRHPSVAHTAARKEDGGMIVVDLWESPEAFGRFAEEQIAPAGASVGLGPIEPRMIPVHNRIRGGTRQPAA